MSGFQQQQQKNSKTLSTAKPTVLKDSERIINKHGRDVGIIRPEM